MKFICVTAECPFGPDETFIIPEVHEAIRQGHEVLLVPRDKPSAMVNKDAESLVAFAIGESLCSVGILRSAFGAVMRRPKAALGALRLLRGARNPGVFVKNLFVLPKGLWLAETAVRRGVEHIHAHWGITTATMAMIASEVSGIPWSFTAHRGDIVADNLLKTKVRHASFVRVIAESSLRLIEAIVGVAVAEKAVVLHMGVRIPEGLPLEPAAGRTSTILCPANLLPVKGHQYLLQAIAMLKARTVRCEAHFAGDGPLRASLENQAVSLDIADRVRFLGRVPHDQIVSRYRNGQVAAVVLPSVDLGGGVHEGIPVALMEAMAFGVPVVSTTTGGIPELVRDGAGILVPPADPASLADALERLIRDPSLRERLSSAGRQRVVQEFAVERTVKTLMSLWAPSTSPRNAEEKAPTRKAA